MNKGILFKTMKARGVDEGICKVIQGMYEEEESAIIMNGNSGKWFKIEKGVRQGGCSSPVCFNFVPNELAWEIEKSPYGIKLPGGKKIGILLYADDIVLIDDTERGLQGLCGIVEEWLKKYKLRINFEKSEAVSYGTRKDPHIRIQEMVLKVSDYYKYLGFITEKTVRGKGHIKDRKNKMKNALGFFLGLTNTLEGLPVEKRRTMARACIETVGLYGTETMVSTDKHMRVIEELEVIQRRHARNLLRASRNTANEIVTMELGLMTVKGMMDLRLLAFRHRMACENKGTLNETMYKLNKARGLGWEKDA